MFNKLSKFIHKNLFKGLFLGGLIASGVMLVLYFVLLMFDVKFLNANVGFHILYLLTTLSFATLGLLAKKLSYLEADNEQLFNACNELITSFNSLEEKLNAAPVVEEAAPAAVEAPVVEEVEEEPVVEEKVEEPAVEEVAEPVKEESVVEEKPVAPKKAPVKKPAAKTTTAAKKPVAKKPVAKTTTTAKKPATKKESELAALTKEVSKLSKKLDKMSK